jgi:single-strand DNA-binding protein|nr:MAG TPA: Single stranded DNA binding protein [Caudoviricetes sp.]
MPHIITGEIRRDVFRKEGSNNNGTYVMYGVDMSESFKDRRQNNERVYTNYKATLFAKTPAAISFYDDILVKGKIVSIQSDALNIDQREGNNGQTYITLEMVDPKLLFGQKTPQSGGWGEPQQPSQPRQQTQQPQRQPQQQAPQRQQQTSGFDDDIPF